MPAQDTDKTTMSWREAGKHTPVHAAVQAVSFTPGGQLLAVLAPLPPNTEWWDGSPFPHWQTSWLVIGERLVACPDLDALYPVFSRDGKLLATSDGAKATVWNLTTKKRVSEMSLPCGQFCQAFSPDGTILATGHRRHQPAAGR